MKYIPRRDIPDFARELRTVSPSRIADWILAKRNVKRKPQSITMWFKDHPDMHDQLSKELAENLPTERQTVDERIFERGNFEELPSVKKWIQDLTLRNAKETTIRGWVNQLKRVCQEKYKKVF